MNPEDRTVKTEHHGYALVDDDGLATFIDDQGKDGMFSYPLFFGRREEAQKYMRLFNESPVRIPDTPLRMVTAKITIHES